MRTFAAGLTLILLSMTPYAHSIEPSERQQLGSEIFNLLHNVKTSRPENPDGQEAPFIPTKTTDQDLLRLRSKLNSIVGEMFELAGGRKCQTKPGVESEDALGWISFDGKCVKEKGLLLVNKFPNSKLSENSRFTQLITGYRAFLEAMNNDEPAERARPFLRAYAIAFSAETLPAFRADSLNSIGHDGNLAIWKAQRSLELRGASGQISYVSNCPVGNRDLCVVSYLTTVASLLKPSVWKHPSLEAEAKRLEKMAEQIAARQVEIPISEGAFKADLDKAFKPTWTEIRKALKEMKNIN